MTRLPRFETAKTLVSVVIICDANICRSPLIAFEAGRSGAVLAQSAGMSAREGFPICLLAAEQIEKYDGGTNHVNSFRSRALQSLDLEAFDLLLTTTTDMRSNLVKQHPGFRSKTFTVLEALDLIRLPPNSTELLELRVNGPAAVMFARRGTVASSPAQQPSRKGNRNDALDISDGHSGRRNRHHLATIDLAARAGRELGELLLGWDCAAMETTEPEP